MGFFTWFRSCGTVSDDEPHSLVRTNYGNPDQTEIQEAAAEDVARIEQDDKYFHRDPSDDL